LLALEQAIEEKIKTAGPMKMTGGELTVLPVLALDREVANGGYKQFFSNSSRRFHTRNCEPSRHHRPYRRSGHHSAGLDSLDLPKLSIPAIEAA